VDRGHAILLRYRPAGRTRHPADTGRLVKSHILSRKWHRHVAILVAVPFLVVLVTGILLQVKKQVRWVQPPTVKGTGKEPTVPFTVILAATAGVPEAEVKGWPDIDRLDVRPKDGVVKVQCRNGYEVQVDSRTGQVLQVEYRRSDLIESIHDGSYFHDAAKLYVFLPAAVLLLTVWVTGVHLWLLPKWVKWRRKPAPTNRPLVQ